MSSEVYGNIATVRPSWHGNDNLLTPEEAKNIDVVAEKSGLDYTLVKADLWTRDETGDEYEVDGFSSILRTDTNVTLSVVGEKYNLVQPREVLEFFREVVEHFGWSIETAGVLKGGRVYWAMAKIGFTLDFEKESMSQYLMLLSSCDGTLATTGIFTEVFVVCWNTLSMSLMHPGFHVRNTHSKPFDAAAMKRGLGISMEKLKGCVNEDILFYKECSRVRMSANML